MKKLKILIVAAFMAIVFSGYSQDGMMGEIKMFAGNFAPQNWAFCDGQLLSIAQYSALFSLLGTTYGGNGQTTFQLPDLRGRVPVASGQGSGLSNYDLGQTGGTENVTLSTGNLPAHTHTINAVSAAGTTNNPSGAVMGNAGSFDNEYSTATPTTTMSSSMVGSTGSNLSVSILQPYVTISFIICTSGIYPSRP